MAQNAQNWKGEGEMIAEDAPALQGPVLAQRLAPWFALQLAFAARCAELAGISPAEAITHYTAIYKRMGFGPNARGPLHEEWLALGPALDAAGSVDAQLAILMPELEQRIVGYRHYSRELYGCFSFDAPDGEGQVKLHFIPDHSDAQAGPLHASNRPARMAELKSMFAHIRQAHGEAAKSVRGLSWLYHTRAYGSLFPEAFTTSLSPDPDPALPQGMRYWGQFLTHRCQLRPETAEPFRAGLSRLDLSRLPDAFPHPPLEAKASISAFYRHFGL